MEFRQRRGNIKTNGISEKLSNNVIELAYTTNPESCTSGRTEVNESQTYTPISTTRKLENV